MAERSILAYFNTPDEAQKALEQLKKLKLADSSIDRFDGMPGDGLDVVTNPLTGEFRRLGNLTMHGDFKDQDVGILVAANVSASGMSSNGPENVVTGRDILLTAVVDEADYEKALDIVKKAGAL
ncbi:hypothetical protein E5161_08800 [Cohnella pontilimi]|uniref:Uncharacterized protein n=1 Tax=Cohnella pontilimi TaxID=2564100 RepID=A0A4U0FDQ5_9BACL|nr:hypothetical protein [Cohnella pontilimi]TJY42921.1 hypothetical protein E5161_08800 [Cohnella pontilimi]